MKVSVVAELSLLEITEVLVTAARVKIGKEVAVGGSTVELIIKDSKVEGALVKFHGSKN